MPATRRPSGMLLGAGRFIQLCKKRPSKLGQSSIPGITQGCRVPQQSPVVCRQSRFGAKKVVRNGQKSNKLITAVISIEGR